MRATPLLLLVMLAAPLAAAEFGHETGGYPVNVDGETILPYVPEHWAERHPDVVAGLLEERGAEAEPLNKVAGSTVFPYYALLTAEVQRLASEYPDLVRLHVAGQSHAGLNLWLLEIADFGNPDRLPLAEREVVYLDGGTHSNEYSGVYFVTEWAQFLLDEHETNETAKWIVENRHTWILPMVNPDGSHAFGRINAIDVNINRNFPSTWGTVAELPVLNWPGLYPMSEPETRAVVSTLEAIQPDYVNSIHCCGNLWLHPFGAEQLGLSADNDMFTRVCDEVFADVRDACGPIWSTIYPASGTTADEGYGTAGAASWTYEMSGRGAMVGWGQPVVATDVRQQEIESWRGVMHAFLYTEQYGGLPVVTAMRGDADQMTVTVQNQGLGNLSQATLSVGGASVALDDLVPGASGTYQLDGSFAAGAVPVELEWKKRLHPDSNWGRQLVHVDLTGASGGLVALLPEAIAKPAMGSLLPASDAEPLVTDSMSGVGEEASSSQSVPGLGAGAAILALALLGVAVARRR